jgi:hypothetical protein
MYGMLAKPPPTLRARILRLLNGRQIHGRADLITELFPKGFSLDENRQFNWALNALISEGLVLETRRELPGAHEFPAAIEYVYSLPKPPPGAKKSPGALAGFGTTRKLSADGLTWEIFKDGRKIDEIPV